MTRTKCSQKKGQTGKASQLLADMCHNCRICTTADKKPDSTFEKVMRWHRTWCPAWAAHRKIYGEKPLSR